MNVGTDEKVSQNQNLAKKLSIMLKNAGGYTVKNKVCIPH